MPLGINGLGAMSNPNLMQGYGGMGVPIGYGYQQYPNYAAIQQRQYLQQEGMLDQKTRSRVDAWRQSVMP